MGYRDSGNHHTGPSGSPTSHDPRPSPASTYSGQERHVIEMVEAANPGVWLSDIDRVLVRFGESRSICSKVTYFPKRTENMGWEGLGYIPFAGDSEKNSVEWYCLMAQVANKCDEHCYENPIRDRKDHDVVFNFESATAGGLGAYGFRSLRWVDCLHIKTPHNVNLSHM